MVYLSAQENVTISAHGKVLSYLTKNLEIMSWFHVKGCLKNGHDYMKSNNINKYKFSSFATQRKLLC